MRGIRGSRLLRAAVLPVAAVSVALFAAGCGDDEDEPAAPATSAAAASDVAPASSTAAADTEAASSEATPESSAAAEDTAAGSSEAPAEETEAAGSGKVGDNIWFLMPNSTIARLESQDRPFFEANIKSVAPDVKVTVVNAEGSNEKQLAQAEAALADGADVIAVMANDQTAAGVIVEKAHEAGVPVIGVERPINDAPLDYIAAVRVQDMGVTMGEWIMANTKDGDRIAVVNGDKTDGNAVLFNEGYMSVLQPAFDAGTRVEVANVWTPGWDPANAQREMEQILTKENNEVDAVLASNDGLAGGVIAALKAQDMTVPVTGVDASLAGVQRVLKGEQGMTLLISINELHQQVGAIAGALLKGEEPPADLFTGTFDNGTAEGVPWAARSGVLIDKDTYQAAIDDGGFTLEELCEGLDAGTGPC
jgi:D-xylose transport system substrate-binding protein